MTCCTFVEVLIIHLEDNLMTQLEIPELEDIEQVQNQQQQQANSTTDFTSGVDPVDAVDLVVELGKGALDLVSSVLGSIDL